MGEEKWEKRRRNRRSGRSNGCFLAGLVDLIPHLFLRLAQAATVNFQRLGEGGGVQSAHLGPMIASDSIT